MRMLGICILVLSFWAALLPNHGAAAQDRAARVKAVFLFKFTDYIKWPDGQTPKDSGRFDMCIWGNHPFEDILDTIAQRHRAYKYVVKYVPQTQAPKNCHLIFVGQVKHDLSGLDGAFLVSDYPGFSTQGGMIEMIESQGKVKLKANLKTAESAGFRINSRLLDLMDVIR